MAHHRREEEKETWDIVLPGQEYVLQQWLVRDGSLVQSGDKVATAVQKGAASSSSHSEPAAAVVKHKRPKKRKRIGDSDATTDNVSTVKKLSAYLPKDNNVITIFAPSAGVLRIQRSNNLDSLTIGYVEPCQHPAIMGGLCAVCGTLMGPQSQQSQSTSVLHPPSFVAPSNMSQVTVSGGVTMTISETEAEQISKQTSKRLLHQKKLSLVLDLDHTLVHATADVRARSHYVARHDVRTLILPVFMEEFRAHPIPRWMQHFVKLRPHVHEFLTEAQKLYEISVYTAGTRMYAEHVCMALSRCMVGATRDEEELQRLRHAVVCAEYEMANKQKEDDKGTVTGQGNANEEAIANSQDGKDAPTIAQEGDVTNETLVLPKDPPTNGETKTTGEDSKKKKVSFGEPPETSKTDKMTSGRMEELKRELQEAEEKEQEALDVRQRVFGSRIVSRTDVGDLGRDVKSLERIFPGGGSMALIVDDREDVWANAQDNSKQNGEPPENLLLIRPYHWKPFLGFADVNNSAGEDISGESTTTEDEDDCALLWTLDILKRMHKRFYTAVKETGSVEITVPPLIREMRQEVLEGCTLVFSGLVPLHHQNRTSKFPRPAVVRYGESLGAKVSCRHVLCLV